METQWLNTQSMQLRYNISLSEQIQYQQDVFRTLMKWVSAICGALCIAYLLPSFEYGTWPAFVLGLSFLAMTAISASSIFLVNDKNFKWFVRGFLLLGTWTIFAFGFLQSNEFIHIMAFGATVIIVMAIFLEPMHISYQWACCNIAGYILILLTRSSFHFPAIDLGNLQPWVVYGTPIVILVIITELGRVTTQHFKRSQLLSEIRRMQVEAQEQQLRALTARAEEARDKAEQSDRVKSAFLASMSHELRTPLNSIINFTRFVAEGYIGPVSEQQKTMLNDAVASAYHLLNLINDVLDMSKIESGKLTLFIEESIDLKQIVDTAVSTTKSLIMGKPVEMLVSVPDSLPRLRADHQRLVQVFLNILSNACKFTDEGHIAIRSYCENENVVVTIEDTGPGIAPEEQPLVFEAFTQTESGVRSAGGTGLGMPISKNLVEAHGGCLWLESEPGKGTTFFVSLPIKSQQLTPITFSLVE